MPTEPTPRRSEDELIALVRHKAAGMRQRRRIAALGAGSLALLLIASGIALAGNGSTGTKRTVRVAGEGPTTTVGEDTTTSTGPSTTVAVTTSTSTSIPPPRVKTTTTTRPAAGLVVTVVNEPQSGQVGTDVKFTVHIADGDGMITRYQFVFGDGTGDLGYMVESQCIDGPPPSLDRYPTDKTYEYVHRYQSAGTFQATADVTTGGGCPGSPAPEHSVVSASYEAVGTPTPQATTTTTAPGS